MSKSLFRFFSLILLVFISSCSNKVEKNYSPQEITNLLLINEQVPIKTLSNALKWPEELILGLDLGLIELNEDGKERLKDVLNEYEDDGKDEFLKDNIEKKWTEFVKSEWIRSENAKISSSKLIDIKEREFKNNELIQNNLNRFIPLYIERQTEELSSYQFSFFSKGFWKNLVQITWIHTKSAFFGKLYNLDISYIEPVYKKELQQKWEQIYNSYFSIKEAENELKKITKNYQALLVLKYNYISKLKKINTEKQPLIFLKQLKLKQKNNVDIRLIISQFNITIIDNFGLLFLELFLGLFIFAFVQYILIKLFYSEELEIHNEINNLLLTFVKAPMTPIIQGVVFLSGFTNEFLRDRKIESRAEPIAKNLKTFLGIFLLAVSIWYFPQKQIKIENKINRNLETSFISYFDKSSILILDDLNFNTEIFFTSI